MAARGKSLAITAEQIEDILNLPYGAARTCAVLAALFPHVNTRNIHHVDHIFPQALLSKAKLKQAGITGEAADEFQAKRDLLPNLELLEGAENISKSDSVPATWASTVFTAPNALEAYLDRNAIRRLPADAHEFADFYNERRAALTQRIVHFLGVASSDVGAEDTRPTESGLWETIDEGLADSSYDD